MSPASHLFLSWCVANTLRSSRRDRLLITIAGIIPDIDGVGILLRTVHQYNQQALALWSRFHHTFGHTLFFGVSISLLMFFFARRKVSVFLLSLASFHLHLFCDLIGSRGPDNYQWPIPYLWPLTDKVQLTWEGQWALNAWPNFIVTTCAIVLTLYLSWRRGYGIFESISTKADRSIVAVLRNRFGNPDHAPQTAGENHGKKNSFPHGH